MPHHQRVPRKTRTRKPASVPSSRGGIIELRSDRPQSQTAGPGDGRARRRRRRRSDDDDGNVRGTVTSDGGRVAAVVAVVARDGRVGGAFGAAVVGVERVGVGVVPRGCPAPRSSESSCPAIGRRSPPPLSPVGTVGRHTTERRRYAALSHGEEVEGVSVAGSRGRSAGAAGGRDARGPPAGAAAARDTSDRGRHGEALAQAA